MPDHGYFANLIWQIADLLRGPHRPPQYERVMLPMTVLRRFEALDGVLNRVAGQRSYNRSPLDFEHLQRDPDHIDKHLVSYIKGFSRNVRNTFDFFEFEGELEKLRDTNTCCSRSTSTATSPPPPLEKIGDPEWRQSL